MGLIDDDKKIVREEIHQRIGRHPRSQPRQMSGIILNTGTKARFLHHFNIKIRPFCNSLRLQKLVLALKVADLLFQLLLDMDRCLFDLFHGSYIMGSREDRCMFQRPLYRSHKRIDLRDPVDLIPEKFHPDCCI